MVQLFIMHVIKVREWLNQNFSNRGIRKNGRVLLPPHSTDLHPVIFLMSGHMKELVYSSSINTMDEFYAHVHGFLTPLTRDFLIHQTRASIDTERRHCEQFVMDSINKR
jgi:hypothetical protein